MNYMVKMIVDAHFEGGARVSQPLTNPQGSGRQAAARGPNLALQQKYSAP